MGVYWEKCTKNRRASVVELLARLKDRTGEDKHPAIRFFKNCVNTVRTVPSIGTDKSDPELPEDGGEDHWLDAVLYACMYRPRPAKHDELPRSQKHYDELGVARRRRAAAKQAIGATFGYGR
jgi:hypothetical protein